MTTTRLLIIEDDVVTARSLAQGLSAEGSSVRTASCGEDALHSLAVQLPDLLVLDWMLPGPDGIEILRWLRERGARVPVLLLTARDALEERVTGLDAGAVKPQPLLLREQLAAWLEQVQVLAEEREVRLELDCSSELRELALLTDVALLGHAVNNVLHNAIQHSPAGSLVKVELSRSPAAASQTDWVSIAIRDQGPGIARKDQPRVFERFYRVDKSRGRARSERRSGHGLGLCIAKAAVARLGGTLALHSELGSGATFTITLPLPQASPHHAPQSEVASAHAELQSAAANERASDAGVDAPDLCFMGSSVVSGTATARVLQTGARTRLGQLSHSLVSQRPATAFDLGLNRVSWLLIKFMGVMVPIVFLLNGVAKGDWLEAFFFAVAVALGLTPEMLPMIVNANLARGAAAMAREKTVVKRMSSMQNFGAMDLLCTDKTGTLTQDHVALIRYLDVTGEPSARVLEHAYLNSAFQTGLKNLIDRAVLDKASSVACAVPHRPTPR